MDKATQDYDRYFVPLLRHCSERCVTLLDLQSGERVLDIATGTGVAAFLAAERVGTGRSRGDGPGGKMLDAARAEAEHRGVANMTFDRMDAEELSFSDGSFGAAMCVLGLMYPADPQRAIEQMHRVRPGDGRQRRSGDGARIAVGIIFPITDAQVQSDVCPLFFQLGAEKALARAFERAGFEVEREERIDRPLKFEGEKEMLARFSPAVQ